MKEKAPKRNFVESGWLDRRRSMSVFFHLRIDRIEKAKSEPFDVERTNEESNGGESQDSNGIRTRELSSYEIIRIL